MIRTLYLSAALSLSIAFGSAVQAETISFTVAGGKADAKNTPVAVAVAVPEGKASSAVAVELGGRKIAGQLAAPRLLSDDQKAPAGKVARELWFIVPELKSGASLQGTATLSDQAAADLPQFAFHDTPGLHTDLTLGGRPVLRYMYEKVDESDKERRHATMKVYHHVFDPKGERLVTKGPGGLFPHHRGLYYGFNKISYTKDGKNMSADVWHCNGGESQQHVKVLAEETGPVLGRHRLLVAWHGKDGKVFAEETREMTAYSTPGGTLIEFASKLESKVDGMKVDGDPQHAGFQFRASQDVPDKTAKLTYYLRPDGKGNPGQFRNWPGNKDHADLPWNALSFVLGEQRYTVAYIDRPENPKEARFSERDYGRFGSYFATSVEQDKPLELNYRVWLQEGEMDVDGVNALAAEFTSGPTAKSK